MAMHITEIQDKNIWEDFIKTQKPHTFLQSWNWAQIQKETKTPTFHLGIYNNHELSAVSTVLHIRARRGSFLFVPHGPIFSPHAQKSEILKILTLYLVKQGAEKKCSFIRISPLLENTPENENLFLQLRFREAPVHLMHPEISWILDIKKPEQEILSQMRKTTRHTIKKAQNDGVKIIKSSDINDLENFWNIYKETSKRQQFTPFSKNFLKKQFEIFSKDKEILLFFSEYEKKFISTAMMVFYNNSAYYHHGASLKDFSKIPASQLLQWEAIREARSRGCEFYNFWGISPDDKTNHPWHGLSVFKKGFGGFSESYVHAKDYILKPHYWINYTIEAFRKHRRGL